MSQAIDIAEGAQYAVVFLHENGSFTVPYSFAADVDVSNSRDVEDHLINIVLEFSEHLLHSDFGLAHLSFMASLGRRHLEQSENVFGPNIASLMKSRGMSVIVYETDDEKVLGLSLFPRDKHETLEQAVKRAIRTAMVEGSQHLQPILPPFRDFETERKRYEPEDIKALVEAQPSSGIFCLSILITDVLQGTTNDYSLALRKIATDLKLATPKDYAVIMREQGGHDDDDDEDLEDACDCVFCATGADIKYVHIPIFQRFTGNTMKTKKLIEFIRTKYNCVSAKMVFVDLEDGSLWLIQAHEDSIGCNFSNITGASYSPFSDDNVASTASSGGGVSALHDFKIDPVI